MAELSFGVQVGITFLAVFLGIPAGFWLQRWIDSLKSKEEKRQLLDFLHQNIKKNLELLSQAKAELGKPGGVIFYPLDLTAWPQIAHRVTIFDDVELTSKLQYIYYELAHLQRKIDSQYNLYEQSLQFPPSDPLVTDFNIKIFNFVDKKILPHIEVIEKSGNALIKSIDQKRYGLK